jgi:hypothetical protein
MGNGSSVLPSILNEDNIGAIFMAKKTAIGQRTKHVDIRYRFVNDKILAKELWVEHIRSGENPSDAMTKNLPLNLSAKHAALILDGLLGKLYYPQNTEDVKIYCATVLDNETVPSTTVSSSPVLDSDSTVAICTDDHIGASDDSWTVVPTKTRKWRDPVEAWIPQDSMKVRDQQRIHGTGRMARLSQVLYENEAAPVDFTRKAISFRKRSVWKPNQ